MFQSINFDYPICILFSEGHASVVQRLLELPTGSIDFDEVGDERKTGYGWAKENSHTAIVEMLTNAGHTNSGNVCSIM